ncbi:MAG: ABC transporter substrate-binding protein [Chloroflexi bacterium OHK40]
MRLRQIGCALVLLTLLAACTPAAPPPPPDEPRGTLRWSLEGVADIQRLDPARLGGHQENIPIYLIFGGLVRINDRLEVVGDGAERWTVSGDGTVYTFYLRRNLRYGNGEPATAQHFADALARTLAPATGTDFALAFLENVVGAREVRNGTAQSLAGVRVIDPTTLEITLDSPRGYFLSQLTYALTYLVPPGAIEAAGAAWLRQAFGTGPFRVREHEPGQRLVLEGNPHYWGGRPSLETVVFRFYPDTESAFDAYEAGEVDIMGSIQSGIPLTRLDDVRGRPDVIRLSAPVVRYIGFNTTRPPFNNVYVRQAFAQAVDKDDLARQVLGGAATPADRILPRGFPGTALPVDPVPYDPVNGARAALGLAGYQTGAALPPVRLTYERGDPDLDRVARALQATWRDTLGVDVRLEPVSRDALIAGLDALIANPSDPEGLQMYISIWGADYPDPQNFISLQLRSDSPYNNGRWSNQRFDELTAEADRLSGAGTQRERFALYRDAEQIAVREVGWLPLYHPEVTIAIRPTVRGLAATVTPQGIIANDWTRVQIVEEAADQTVR